MDNPQSAIRNPQSEDPQPAQSAVDSIRNPQSAIRNRPDLTIVIVNYNAWSCLPTCLHSVQSHTGAINCEIIVIDNDSSDGSPENLRKMFPNVRCIENSSNIGFARACNQGIKAAAGPYILLLNPDAFFVSGTLADTVRYLREHLEIGILGGKVLNEDGSLQLACRRSIPTLRSAFFRFAGLSKLFPQNPTFAAYNLTYADEDQIAQVEAVSGAFMMFPRQLADVVGGFDERFFIYGEDLDFCLRLAKTGKHVVYWPRIVVKHVKGQSIKSWRYVSLYHFYHAMWIFYRKHYYPNNSWLENCATYMGIWILGVSRLLLSVLAAPFSRMKN